MNPPQDKERLSAAAERVRESGALGRSRMLQRLFDFLLERSLQGDSPKEVEVASEVFGKSESDLLVDASVRVYVHRLRKKLEDFYAGEGAGEDDRLSLPKGDYRFRLGTAGDEEADGADAHSEPPTQTGVRRSQPWLFGLGAFLLGAALVAAATLLWSRSEPLSEVRRSALWSPLVEGGRSTTIVTGDYYIMGEREKPDSEPSRLVREYGINSREDLDALLMDRPDLRDKLVDLDLFYLPVSTGYALNAVLPVVDGAQEGRASTRIVPSSNLVPTDLKDDIVYVGLMSGLGLLQQPVFADSRFDFAGSFDELIDTKTGQIYVADPPQDGQTARRNYAYLAALPGPNGNRIIIVAGTRDPALLQAADIATNPAQLAKLAAVSKTGYFEALFAVDGVGNDNLKGTLIVASPRSAGGLWDTTSDTAGVPVAP